MTIQQDIDKILHPIEQAVGKALADAKAKAEAEKAVLAADVRAKVAQAEAALKALEPEVEAALKLGAKTIMDAVEVALAAHGL